MPDILHQSTVWWCENTYILYKYLRYIPHECYRLIFKIYLARLQTVTCCLQINVLFLVSLKFSEVKPSNSNMECDGSHLAC